ncbi:MAG TPA: hypothetical protein VFQ53_07315 [Kofleriaceae bacterium]|nr:hypothetical protein [Kofleriaceae bacterium]
MRLAVLVAALSCACGAKDSPKATSAGSATPVTQTTPSTIPPATEPAGSGSAIADKPITPMQPAKDDAAKSPPTEPALEGHDFTQAARELFAVGACGDVPVPEGYPEALVAKHCKAIKTTQTDYAEKWVKPARAFFAEKVPPNLPKKVVYPFAGGDLSTALTVFPDADEITTMSLEPAGDPRTLAVLNTAATTPTGKSGKPSASAKAALESALATVEKELRFLYRVNFSNTMNMIDAMRGGTLPTQLIFGLSALKVHGYEVVGLRYFRLDDNGNIKYLTDEDVAAAPDPAHNEHVQNEKRNRVFANAELRFRKPGGRVQIYRHIQQNLDNEHLKSDPRVKKHLEQKGKIVSMTKAASYLLSYDSFSILRDYLLANTEWMVSDATGIAPKWGKKAGFEYETYGGFKEPHIPSGNGVAKDWRDEFEAQPKRELKFRFGYYDKRIVDHLVIMRRKS